MEAMEAKIWVGALMPSSVLRPFWAYSCYGQSIPAGYV